MKLWKVKTHLIAKGVFQYSLIAYLILLLAETIKEGLVSFFFNLNIVLAIVLLSGIILIFTHQEKLDEHLYPETRQNLRKRDILFALLLSFGGAFVVLYKTIDLGNLSIVIALIALVVILLLSFLILSSEEKE